jgi:hypothetical protein
VHHEPPDEVCGELELEVGADLGEVRPAGFDLVPVDLVPVDLVPPVRPVEVLVPFAGALLVVDGAVAADDVTPGSA